MVCVCEIEQERKTSFLFLCNNCYYVRRSCRNTKRDPKPLFPFLQTRHDGCRPRAEWIRDLSGMYFQSASIRDSRINSRKDWYNKSLCELIHSIHTYEESRRSILILCIKWYINCMIIISTHKIRRNDKFRFIFSTFTIAYGLENFECSIGSEERIFWNISVVV